MAYIDSQEPQQSSHPRSGTELRPCTEGDDVCADLEMPHPHDFAGCLGGVQKTLVDHSVVLAPHECLHKTIRTYIYIYIYMYVCIYIYMCVYPYISLTYVLYLQARCVYIYMCVEVCKGHIYIYIYIHIHTYTAVQ